MIKLADKPNVTPAGPTFNYGNITDDDGSGNGTPVNLIVYNDVHQFFETLMVYGGITPNGLVDNDDNGYQLISAFAAGAKIATKSLMGALAETIIGDPSLILSSGSPRAMLGLTWNIGLTVLSSGYVFYNGEILFCPGYTGAIVDTAVFNRIAPNVIIVSDAVSGSGDFDYSALVFIQPTAPKLVAAETNSESGTGSTATLKFGTETSDAYGVYNISNGRYTPTKAGFHEVNVKAMVTIAAALSTFDVQLGLYKNGLLVKVLHNEFPYPGSNSTANCDGSYIVSMNGSSDFCEIRLAFSSSQSWSMSGNVTWKWLPNN